MTSTAPVEGLRICNHQFAYLALCVKPEIKVLVLHLHLVDQRLNRHILILRTLVSLLFSLYISRLCCRNPDVPVGRHQFALLASHLLSHPQLLDI